MGKGSVVRVEFFWKLPRWRSAQMYFSNVTLGSWLVWRERLCRTGGHGILQIGWGDQKQQKRIFVRLARVQHRKFIPTHQVNGGRHPQDTAEWSLWRGVLGFSASYQHVLEETTSFRCSLMLALKLFLCKVVFVCSSTVVVVVLRDFLGVGVNSNCLTVWVIAMYIRNIILCIF